jgi:hypothetical protein
MNFQRSLFLVCSQWVNGPGGLTFSDVIPANAGIHVRGSQQHPSQVWLTAYIPAFAGMTS